MDIEKLIRIEAPTDSDHDIAYSEALRESYEDHKGLSETQLIKAQIGARNNCVGRHNEVADCVVIYALLNEMGKTNVSDEDESLDLLQTILTNVDNGSLTNLEFRRLIRDTLTAIDDIEYPNKSLMEKT